MAHCNISEKIAVLWGNRNNVYLIFSHLWSDTNTVMSRAIHQVEFCLIFDNHHYILHIFDFW